MGTAIPLISAYFYPDWTILYARSKVPMSVRGKIRTGIYFAYFGLGALTIQIVRSKVLYGFYLGGMLLLLMFWVSRVFLEDRREYLKLNHDKNKTTN
jgi:hypothetical protein